MYLNTCPSSMTFNGKLLKLAVHKNRRLLGLSVAYSMQSKTKLSET